jgi:hypothetical protein
MLLLWEGDSLQPAKILPWRGMSDPLSPVAPHDRLVVIYLRILQQSVLRSAKPLRPTRTVNVYLCQLSRGVPRAGLVQVGSARPRAREREGGGGGGRRGTETLCAFAVS